MCSRLLLFPLGALWPLPSRADVGAQGTCSAPGEADCGNPHYVPFKGNNLNRSGYSPYLGPFDVSRPAWLWEEPNRDQKRECVGTMACFHSSPIIDADLNVYIQSTTGWVYSIDKSGKTRWEAKLTSCNPSNVALRGDSVYVVSQDGMLWSLDRATGKVQWYQKAALGFPDDTHSLLAVGDTVLAACNPYGYGTQARPLMHEGHPIVWRSLTYGNENVCAFSAKDGTLKWNYSMWERSGNISYNQMQAVVGNSVIFGDSLGGAYRVSFDNGQELWHTPALTELGHFHRHGGMGMGSTANMVVGPNGKTYHAYNIFPKVGAVRVLNIEDGSEAWRFDRFHEEINAAPAVGTVFGHNKLATVLVIGGNCACEKQPFKEKLKNFFGLQKHWDRYGKVAALDAETGQHIWSFDVPFWNDACAGQTWTDTSCPDMFGNPAIGGDGTVYVNWSGGKHYSLRDVNLDGKVDPNTPGEVSVYHHGFASNGITAVAPGLTVFPNTRSLVAYHT